MTDSFCTSGTAVKEGGAVMLVEETTRLGGIQGMSVTACVLGTIRAGVEATETAGILVTIADGVLATDVVELDAVMTGGFLWEGR